MALEEDIDIAAALRAGDVSQLRALAERYKTPDLAEHLQALSTQERAVVFRALHRSRAAALFECLPVWLQEELVHSLGDAEVADLLEHMAHDDRTALLEELPAGCDAPPARRPFGRAPRDRQASARLREGSVGRLMTLDFLSVPQDRTVAQVLEHIRRFGHDSETLNVIYVVDESGFLVDDVRTRELLLAEPTASLATLLDRRPTVVRASDDQATAIATFKKQRPGGAPCRRLRGGSARDRDRGRHSPRSRGAQHGGDPEARRSGGARSPLLVDDLRLHAPEARRLARRSLPRRDAHRH